MTAPYHPDTGDLITASHRQVTRIRATHPGFEAPLDLDYLDFRLTWDETRTPRVTLDVDVPAGAPIDVLDPRTGVRVEVDAGYLRPDGTEDVHLVANLALREVRHQALTALHTLRATGDEALVVDASPAVTGSVTSSSHSGAIRDLIRQCISPAPRFITTIDGGPVTLDPVLDRWDAIEDLSDRIEADVYDRGDRTWVIEARPELATADPAHALTTGPAGTVTARTSETSRDSWANYILLLNRWRDPTTDEDREIRATRYVTAGPYAVTGTAGKRILPVTRETPTTQAAANAAARTLLTRALSRATTHTVTAIAAWWIRPGHTVTIDDSAELVSAVTFTADGTMTVSTRHPIGDVDSATSTPDGGGRTVDPTPPATQRYVSQWVASSSASYLGSGTKRTDTTDAVQGSAPDTPQNGNQRAILLFTAANSTGDETGQSITGALPADSRLEKAELDFTLEHSWSGSGGMVRVGYYTGTALPATFTTARPYVASTRIPRGTRYTLNVTNPGLLAGLLAGTVRGLTLGPGLTTDHYVRVAGAADSSTAARPVLRLTYSK